MTNIVNNSSICCMLSLHSRSASDSSWASWVDSVSVEGRESTSSSFSCEGEGSPSKTKDSDAEADMQA